MTKQNLINNLSLPKITILFFIAFGIFPTLKAQTGPGGIGTNDGTSNLEFWYMAQDENYTDGDLVDTIFDRSGNNRTIVAATTERPQFTFATAGANNMASLLFDGDGELEAVYPG